MNHPSDLLDLRKYQKEAEVAIGYFESMRKRHPKLHVMVTKAAFISRDYHYVVLILPVDLAIG